MRGRLFLSKVPKYLQKADNHIIFPNIKANALVSEWSYIKVRKLVFTHHCNESKQITNFPTMPLRHKMALFVKHGHWAMSNGSTSLLVDASNQPLSWYPLPSKGLPIGLFQSTLRKSKALVALAWVGCVWVRYAKVCVLTSIQQEVVFDSFQVSNEIIVGDKILEEVFIPCFVRFFVPMPSSSSSSVECCALLLNAST